MIVGVNVSIVLSWKVLLRVGSDIREKRYRFK